MEDFIPKWGGTFNSGGHYEKIIHCFTIDDDMVISRSHNKNEEFPIGKNALFIAMPSRYSPVQS